MLQSASSSSTDHAVEPIPVDEASEPATAAATIPPSTAGKTPEQIAKEKRIAELMKERLLPYDSGGDDGFKECASYFALAMVAVMFLLLVTDRRKRTTRTGRRAWLRGRF